MEDAGIVYTNLDTPDSEDEPIEARSVGKWFLNIFKGYAGLSVLAAYYQILQVYSAIWTQHTAELYILLVDIIILIPLTVFLAMSAIPAIIILDILEERRIDYVRSWASKLGIVDHVEISFEKITK